LKCPSVAPKYEKLIAKLCIPLAFSKHLINCFSLFRWLCNYSN